MSEKNTILLGVSGGIAAYKSTYLCSKLVQAGLDVEVIMTENALNFITPNTFEALTGHRTMIDTFDRNHEFSTEHVSLADKVSALIVAPATANVLAKFAHGIADDMLTTTVLACDCPKIAAPAMNTRMYENQVTKDNIDLLRKYGWIIAEPGSGHLACGATGKGRMAEPDELLAMIEDTLCKKKDLKGLNVLITAGPTRESLDPVRYITNHSSGKMGYALAKAALSRGAHVTLVSGPVSINPPSGADLISVNSAKEMYAAVITKKDEQDVFIMAAAVADYTPASFSEQKIKKSDDDMTIQLERTSDILKEIGHSKKPGQVVAGFAMETEKLIENATKKLDSKNADLIVANNTKDEGAGFGTDTNKIALISQNGTEEIPLLSKDECAHIILDKITEIKKQNR